MWMGLNFLSWLLWFASVEHSHQLCIVRFLPGWLWELYIPQVFPSVSLSTERLRYCWPEQEPAVCGTCESRPSPHLITLYQHLLCFHSVVIKCGTFLPKCLEACLETSVYSAALSWSPYVLKTAWPGSRNISAKLECVTQRQAKSSLEKR